MTVAPSDTPRRHGKRDDTGRTVNRAFNDFLRLRDLDRDLVIRYRRTLGRGGKRFARIFYDYLLAFPATAAAIARFQARGGRIEDLVRRQVEHLSGLLSGDTDEHSAERIIQMGEVHQRHGIEPVWMLGAYVLYLDHLQTLIRTSAPVRDADRPALENGITRLLFRDMGLALEGYWRASLRDLEHERAKVGELQTQITSLLSNLPQLLWSIDVKSNRALYVSPAAREICQGDVSLPIPCLKQTLAPDREQVRQAWRKALRGERVEIESRVRLPDGELRWFRRVFCPFADAAGDVIRVDGLMEETTAARRQMQELHALATTDVLTGLPNRALFYDRLNQAIGAARRTGREIVLMLLDLDHFKEINDTWGHPAGDQVLVLVAQRLSATLRSTDTLARLGGDEFAILLPDVADGRQTATRFVKKLAKCFDDPFRLGENELSLRAGIGVVVYPEHGDEPTGLMSRADVAMYGTKNREVDYLVYDAAFDPDGPPRLQLARDLREAIRQEELVLHYQPRVDLRTRRVIAVEGLLRWNHPQQGLLWPDAFLGLAERTGCISTVTDWVIETALRQCKAWRRAGLALGVAVNVSARALHEPTFFNRIRRILRALGSPASSLEIEISESALMHDAEQVRALLARLARLGVRVTIDHFGTGSTSLAALEALPLHALKVDRSFVSDMARNPGHAKIVRSALDLGRNFGYRRVAEGIENRETWDALSALGCDEAQGFLISEPLPVDRLDAWLRESAWRPAPERRRRAAVSTIPPLVPGVSERTARALKARER